MKSKFEIYALSVCFGAVFFLVFSISMGAYNVVQILVPDITMSTYDYEDHLTNDTYWEHINLCSERTPCKARPAEDILTSQREKSFEAQLMLESREGFSRLISSSIFSIIEIIVLLIHWRFAANCRKQA